MASGHPVIVRPDGKPSLGLDPERCARRNRLAALKLKAESVPLRFRPSERPDGAGELLSSVGSLLEELSAQLAAINGLAKRELAEGDVYIHTLEAGNGNFISDRFAFLHRSTLVNVARWGSEPTFAFMNSHAVGDMFGSTPSQLPFGRTFAGKYELWRLPDGSRFERALLQVYMLRGQAPNGEAGPTTDAIDAGISGGTLFDVSLGLYPGALGWVRCDVCGGDVNDYDACPHFPGETYKMTDEEIASQQARGVPGGQATYSLMDWHPAEVSAVYDGAVPGAGFRKQALRRSVARRSTRSRATSVAPAAGPGLFSLRGGRSNGMASATNRHLAALAAALAEPLGRPTDEILALLDDHGVAIGNALGLAAGREPAEDPALVELSPAARAHFERLQKQLDDEKAERQRERDERAAEKRAALARDCTARGQALAAAAGVRRVPGQLGADLAKLADQCARVDAGLGAAEGFALCEALEKFAKALPEHRIGEKVHNGSAADFARTEAGQGAEALPADEEKPRPGALAAAYGERHRKSEPATNGAR